jgi:glutathione S-transferase
MKMKLYEFGPTRSLRARWTLQELGVDFEPVRVNLQAGEHQRPQFLRINPAGKIPVLVDGDMVLTESVASCFISPRNTPIKDCCRPA